MKTPKEKYMYEEKTVRALPIVPEIPIAVIKALETQHNWLDEISNIDRKGEEK